MNCLKQFPRKLKSINWTHLDCVERRLSGFFRFYGRFVSGHPLPFVILPILVASILSMGYFRKNEVTDATFLYTPTDGKAKYERECVHEKWPLVDGNYVPGRAVSELRQAQTIIRARDDGNILRPQYAMAILRLNLFIMYDIKIEYDNRTYNYMDLCLHWKNECFTDPQVGLVSAAFNSANSSWSNLTYPTSTLGSSHVYLASSLGGVGLDQSTHLIQSAQAWLLVYQLRFFPDDMDYLSGLWELEFQRQLLAYSDPLIQLSFFHSQTLSVELKRNGDELVPRFAMSFAILILFAVVVTFALVNGSKFPFIDWAVSKPFLALSGVLSAVMGIGSSIGILAYVGFVYNDIVLVMPYLVLAVGLDNTFLMISALRHTSRSLPARTRISEALAEAASAITITISTEFFAFLTGVGSNIPAVQLFSVHTAVALVMTFIYELTFFVGLLVISARNEEKAKNSLLLCVTTVDPQSPGTRGIISRLFNQGTRPAPQLTDRPAAVPVNGDPHDQLDFVSKWFRDWYAPILMNPVVRSLVLLCFCIYISYAGFLCSQVREGLEPVKLLVKGSYAIPYYKSMERYFWRNGTEMQLVVNNAPNLALKYERDRVKSMINDFANTNHSMGLNGVQFWLFDFEEYLENNQLDLSNMTTFEFYSRVEKFVSSPIYEKRSQDLFWSNISMGNQSIRMIESFRASIGLSGFQSAELQISTVNIMRHLTNDPKYSHFNITTFNPIWLFVDQYQQILPNVLHEIIYGMILMIAIALLLIPHPVASFWVAVTILSVDVGVIGFMTIWDINLDTISMITIIMSIGFSVDFSAYLARAYVVTADKDAPAKEKVKAAMGEIAWPIIQGASSTILGVLSLADLDSYMVVAFFKTAFLVIILALIHGLVFLPVILSVVMPGRVNFCKCRRRRNGNRQEGNLELNGV